MKIVAKYIMLCLMLISTSLFSKRLKEGTYRGIFILNAEKNIELPFNFDVAYKGKKPSIIIRNADERIVVDEIMIKGDSVNFKMPVFDTEFKTVLVGNNLEGFWINNYKATNNKIRFKAVYGEARRFLFEPGKPDPVFEGRWETTFSPGSKDSSKAIGVFKHAEQTDFMSGTFLTETGDYRYLEGIKNGNTMYLSCFDGGHAFMFIAEYNAGNLSGNFYSGATWVEPWTARRNNNFKLADAEEITFVKNRDEKINFSFADVNKKQVSLSDKKFENKPVIIQVMGSWCPNCMDESVYFSHLYKQYNNEGLEIIALAFEKTTDRDKATAQVLRMKNRLKIEYDVLITQQTGKEKAGEILTALNKITAFPTTIFLNREHRIVKVHTGFSGPATGSEYDIYKQRTENLVKQLLKE